MKTNDNDVKLPVKAALAAPVLGRREIETLDLFWNDDRVALSASDIINQLKRQAEYPDDVVSLNTIQSTIERLWKKKLLSRHKHGKAFMYTSVYSKQEVISSLIKEISDALGHGDESVIISGIFTFLKSSIKGNQVDALKFLREDSPHVKYGVR
jgi:predicted transcriptional regulator